MIKTIRTLGVAVKGLLFGDLTTKEFIERVRIALNGSIYPINIPPIEVHPGLDFLLLDLPPRYLPLMPNGVGYVYNTLEKCDVRFQVLDANIIFYHRYHSNRIMGMQGNATTRNEYFPLEDPWYLTSMEDWKAPGTIEYFWPWLEEIIGHIVKAGPKAVGFSVHESNREVTKRFVKALSAKCPEAVIVVGGYDCLYHNVGPGLFPDFDYMVIGEAELTLKPLVEALARGEKPRDLTGILSKYDSADREWLDPPALDDLDAAGFPKYDWTDISLYRTYDDSRLVPITASRGCAWSKCRFCAECLPFKNRSPKSVADEIEFMVSNGFYNFHFNESDVNGDPQNLYNICSEIIKRRIKAKFMGQLRIDRRNTRDYFNHLARAGFTHLRFGVDGWSDNTLRLQRKGYNMDLVFRNLRDCYSANIWVTVNMVIGVPGEKEEDVDEMIENLLKCKDYFDTVESFNTLLLFSNSEYYRNPERYNIHFRGDKNEIYGKHPFAIPSELWYSENPYIDQEVRMRRLDRICVELYRSGLDIGPFASRVVENLKRGNIQGLTD